MLYYLYKGKEVNVDHLYRLHADNLAAATQEAEAIMRHDGIHEGLVLVTLTTIDINLQGEKRDGNATGQTRLEQKTQITTANDSAAGTHTTQAGCSG